MKYLVLLASMLTFAFTTTAEARHSIVHHHYRHHVRVAHSYAVDPGCNTIFPCAGVQASKRGIYIAESSNFGAAVQHYRPVAVRLARHTYRHRAQHEAHHRSNVESTISSIGNGIVRAASGATAHVASSATAAFQCVINALEAQGYPVKFMGGYANGGHIRHSLHYSGLALDVNQLARGVTRPSMPSNEISLANSCGLVSGAQWANNDSGHFQLGGYAGNGRTHYASRRHYRHYASRRHHNTRYAYMH